MRDPLRPWIDCPLGPPVVVVFLEAASVRLRAKELMLEFPAYALLAPAAKAILLLLVFVE